LVITGLVGMEPGIFSSETADDSEYEPREDTARKITLYPVPLSNPVITNGELIEGAIRNVPVTPFETSAYSYRDTTEPFVFPGVNDMVIVLSPAETLDITGAEGALYGITDADNPDDEEAPTELMARNLTL
jgi:hypothetical protein